MEEKKTPAEELDQIIDAEFNCRCEKVVCVPGYYKNQYLKYALEHNTTLPCIGRTMVEMLLSGCQFTDNSWDRNNANQLLSYLNIYSADYMLDEISQLLFELKTRIRHEFPYIEVDVESRFKSFRSILAKIMSKATMGETLEHIFTNIEIVKNIDLEYDEVRKLLLTKLKSNRQKNPSKDSIGYRYIIYSHNQSTKEDDLRACCFELADCMQAFWTQKGYDVIEFKDYINHPKKDTGYQSIHMTVDLGECMIEFQIRTAWMHEQSERGDWAHESVYKDTLIQNFLKDFMYEISKTKNRVEKNEKFGVLKSMQLPNLAISQTPHSEVPRTLSMVRAFDDPEFLLKIHTY